MSNEWIVNTGNSPVYSDMVLSKQTPSGRMNVFSNRNILPYVGRTGWVIEYPEFEADDPQKVRRWVPVGARPELLFKLLKPDVSMYRARFAIECSPQYVYPVSEVFEEEFRWNNSLLRALVAVDTEGAWEIQCFTEKTSWVSVDPARVPTFSDDLFRLKEGAKS